jgi:hypothetical protein
MVAGGIAAVMTAALTAVSLLASLIFIDGVREDLREMNGRLVELREQYLPPNMGERHRPDEQDLPAREPVDESQDQSIEQ